MINGVPLPTGQFNGKLFAPAKIKVIAPAGYNFQSWRKNGTSFFDSHEEIDMPDTKSKFGKGNGCLYADDELASETTMLFALVDP